MARGGEGGESARATESKRKDRCAEVGRRIDDFLEQTDTLRVQYERYFTGVDRMPPARAHDELRRTLSRLTNERMLSTELKFRMESARARFQSYQQYWNRTLRLIEEGRFSRVMTDAARRQRERELEKAKHPDSPQAQDSGKTAGKQGPGSKAQPPRLPDGINSKEARQLFKELVKAKRELGEPTKGMNYGTLVAKLAKEYPKLEAAHGSDFRFVVTTRNGQVKLSARRGKAKSVGAS